MSRAAKPRVLVAIPARDEAERISDCLLAVLASLRHARRAGVIAKGRIAVAAHRCTDGTEALARRALGPEHLVWATDAHASVGRVRSQLVRHAVARTGEPDWLLSTDADSRVPLSWVQDTIVLGREHDVIVGLVELSELGPAAPVRIAHDRLVRAAIRSDGTHGHVYAANLALRWPSYQKAGGFPDAAHGEEHGLLAAARSDGARIRATTELVVTTSGRLSGRPQQGLSTLLSELANQDGTPSRRRWREHNGEGQ